jgi:hypothetical protein
LRTQQLTGQEGNQIGHTKSGQNGYDSGPQDSEGERKEGRVGRREMRDRQPERGEDNETESETETGERNRNRERHRQIETMRDRQAQSFPHLPLLTPSLSPLPPSLLMPLRSDGLGRFHVSVQYIPSMAKFCFSTQEFHRNELHFTHVRDEAEFDPTCIRLTADGTSYNTKVDKHISVPL